MGIRPQPGQAAPGPQREVEESWFQVAWNGNGKVVEPAQLCEFVSAGHIAQTCFYCTCYSMYWVRCRADWGLKQHQQSQGRLHFFILHTVLMLEVFSVLCISDSFHMTLAAAAKTDEGSGKMDATRFISRVVTVWQSAPQTGFSLFLHLCCPITKILGLFIFCLF